MLKKSGLFWYAGRNSPLSGPIMLDAPKIVCEKEGDNDRFVIKGPHCTETFQAVSSDDCREWIEEINKLIKSPGIDDRHFNYRRVTGTLTVEVIDACDLAAKDLNGFSDPFCILYLNSQQFITTTKFKTLNPEWNEKFSFDLSEVPCNLTVYMYDEDTFKANDFMGFTLVPVHVLARDKVTEVICPLKARKRKEDITGSIRLKLSCSFQELAKNFDDDVEFNDLGSETAVLPHIVKSIILYLYRNGMDTKGIFRVSGEQASVIRLLTDFFSKGCAVQLTGTHEDDIHVAASTLKMFLRELKSPLVRFENYDDVIYCGSQSSSGKEFGGVLMWRNIVNKLPQQSFTVLNTVCSLLNHISRNSEHNNMGPSNLAIIFGPIFCRPQEENNMKKMLKEIPLINSGVEYLIKHYDSIFQNQVDPVEALAQSSQL